ncbi:hypothetical protein OF83DRAFT_1200737, partial [Amylostereum chailletii]
NVSHPHWLAANGILNQGWAPDPFKGPSEVNGVWIVEGKVQQVGPSMLVEAAIETGYRYYATVRNHTYARTSPLPLCQTCADLQTAMIVFIICNVNWALPLSPNLPTSCSIAADWYWAFNLRLGALIAPPSLVTKNIACIVDAHLPAMLHHIVGHEGYSVFVFPEWGNLTPMLTEEPWALLSDVVEYLAHARHAIYPFSYSAVEQSLYKLIAEAREASAYQISHEVQERAVAMEKWWREELQQSVPQVLLAQSDTVMLTRVSSPVRSIGWNPDAWRAYLQREGQLVDEATTCDDVSLKAIDNNSCFTFDPSTMLVSAMLPTTMTQITSSFSEPFPIKDNEDYYFATRQ